ncbi:6-bladed beta-propeller [Echinicola strongylocentroti]|uniref:6-bladed beta-propeller n=1 Tax=Echinicola strongylocentroti TaxID=1795355 RepID=UPI0021CE336A|nr:6-bladed beta-propeller [Echinicola strongylocentroti]
MQHIENSKYIAFTPNGMKSGLNRQNSSSCFTIWDIKNGETVNVNSPIEKLKIGHARERNNLTYQNGDLLFSINFLDTIYTLNTCGDVKSKRFFKSEIPSLPLEYVESTNSMLHYLNNSEIRTKYFYHQANLLEDESYFMTRVVKNGKFTNLLYSKNSGKSVLFSQFENDIDFGLKWINPLILDEETLITVTEPMELISQFEEGSPVDSEFYKVTKNLTIDSPLILIKYHLNF